MYTTLPCRNNGTDDGLYGCEICHYDYKFLLCAMDDGEKTLIHFEDRGVDAFVIHAEVVCVRCIPILLQFVQESADMILSFQFQHIILIYPTGTIFAALFIFNINATENKNMIINYVELRVVFLLAFIIYNNIGMRQKLRKES